MYENTAVYTLLKATMECKRVMGGGTHFKDIVQICQKPGFLSVGRC